MTTIGGTDKSATTRSNSWLLASLAALSVVSLSWCRSVISVEAGLGPGEARSRLAVSARMDAGTPSSTGNPLVDGFAQDFVSVRNARSTPLAKWESFLWVDGVDEVEIQVQVRTMIADLVARNVHLTVDPSPEPQLRRLANARVTADNFRAVSQDVGVALAARGPARLVYVAGRTRLVSEACPASCPLPDAFGVRQLP